MKSKLTLTTVALLGLTACPEELFSPLELEATIRASVDRLDFGDVPIGTIEEREIDLHNEGAIWLELVARVTDGQDAVFLVEPPRLTLDGASVRTVTLSFAPDRAGQIEALIAFAEQDGGDDLTQLPVHGRGFVPDCDDQNSCTEDWFDLEARRCRHPARRGPCDDGLNCTEEDACFRGICVGTPVICDDGVECTVDACDESEGCRSTADDRRCDPDRPCFEGQCDPEEGCVTAPSPDGALCGEMSCALMAVCIQGECRTGPAPDGMVCDDGDPCTSGDTCLDGVCIPGPGGGLAISTPLEFDTVDPVSSYWPMNPEAVLAVTVPQEGGLEIVWTDQLSSGEPPPRVVLRTLVDIDGRLISTQVLAQAEMAQATFYDDNLYLLLAGCQTCMICSLELRRVGAAGEVVHSICLDEAAYTPAEVALAVDGQGVYVAQIDDVDPGYREPDVCYDCDNDPLPRAIQAECSRLDDW